MKRFKILIIAIVISVILISVEVVLVRSASNFEPMVSVVYSKTFIAEKNQIKPEMLTTKKVPLRMINKQSVFNISAVKGNAIVDIQDGEAILTSKYSTVADLNDIKVLNKNNRLFTIEFKSDQVNGWCLKTDQFVDILFVPKADDQPKGLKPEITSQLSNPNKLQTENKLTSTVAAKVYDHSIDEYVKKVVRISNVRIAGLIDENGKLLDDTSKFSVPKLISFEVDIKQDAALAYAKGNGRLEVSLIPTK